MRLLIMFAQVSGLVSMAEKEEYSVIILRQFFLFVLENVISGIWFGL